MSKVKTGLVLEGGAMRGIFSAGVLDYMLKKDIYYDYVIGVSAGAGNAVNYVSRQEGRTKKIITHENAESYYGVGQLFENKKILNLEMLVAEYALKDIPYDFDTFFASKTECESVVVNCETGKAEYKGNFKTKDEFRSVRWQAALCHLYANLLKLMVIIILMEALLIRYRLREQLRKGAIRLLLYLPSQRVLSLRIILR